MPINWEHVAGIIWPVLVETAKNGPILTYGDLASRIKIHRRAVRHGVEAAKNGPILTYGGLASRIKIHYPPAHYRSVSLGLGPIQNFCLKQRLPPLTVLVVSEATGEPSIGFIGSDNLEEAYTQVYEYNWDIVENPFGGFGEEDTTESLAQTLVDEPERAGEIYAKVNRSKNIPRHIA